MRLRSLRPSQEGGHDSGPFRLLLLAQDNEGYSNLCRLVTCAHLGEARSAGPFTPQYQEIDRKHPLLRQEHLQQYASHLISISPGTAGEVAQRLAAGDRTGAVRVACYYTDLLGPGNFYLELQHHLEVPRPDALRYRLRALAQDLGLPVVVGNDVHYVARDYAHLQDVLFCLGQGISVRDAHPGRKRNSEYYLKSPAQMARLFADLPEALRATEEIAARCSWELDLEAIHLPRFGVKSERKSTHPTPADRAALLAHLCWKALRRKYAGSPLRDRARRQLAHELAIINQRGLADYFLIVWDLVRFAEARGIRHSGRGSAAGSIVCYLLDITQPEPLSNDLLFERFLNPERRDLPDIDLDFDARRRDEVVAYVYRKYGPEHVAAVATVNTFRARAAVREIGKALGLRESQINRVARNFGYVDLRHLSESLEALPEARSVAGDLAHEQTLLRLCEQVAGFPRHLAVHVGGLIICERPLTDLVPLQLANKGIVVAQYDKDDVEALGLLKMDLLGLRIHTAIEHCLRLIKGGPRPAETPFSPPPAGESAAVGGGERGSPLPACLAPFGRPPSPAYAGEGEEPQKGACRACRDAPEARRRNGGRGNSQSRKTFPLSCQERGPGGEAYPARVLAKPGPSDLDLSTIPLDDPAVYELLRSTHTIGLFQLESPGQRNLQGRILAEHFEDIVASISLFRPGPVQADMITPFIARRRGREPVTYLHPDLRPILERTYGVIIYQEQVMRVAAKMGGFSLGEADRLRKAMNFDSPVEEMACLRETFMAGARRRGLPPSVAEQIFQQIAAFAAFGFNKAHAASFARISYETAYLKAHYPAEYFAGLLTAQPMGFYPARTLAEEAKRLGIAILPPCVNRSEADYTVESGNRISPHSPPLAGERTGPRTTRAGRGGLTHSSEPAFRPPLVRCFAAATLPRKRRRVWRDVEHRPVKAEEGVGIRCGLRFVRGMTEPALESILQARARGGPFHSLRDFLARASVPYPVVENLILARAFEFTGQSIPQLLGLLAALQDRSGERNPSLLGEEEAQIEAASRVDLAEEITPYQRLQLDLHLLGLSTGLSPFAPWVELTQRQGVIPNDRLLEYPHGARVRVAGIVVARARPPVRSGRTTLFLCLEDHTGLVDITVFQEAYQRYGEYLYTAPVLMAEGELTRRGERDVAVTVKRLTPLPPPGPQLAAGKHSAVLPQTDLAHAYAQTGPGSYGV